MEPAATAGVFVGYKLAPGVRGVAFMVGGVGRVRGLHVLDQELGIGSKATSAPH